MARRRALAAGASLLELLLVLVILAILSALALPGSSDRLELHRVAQRAQQLQADLHHARALAALGGRNLRFAITPQGYRVTCVAADDWVDAAWLAANSAGCDPTVPIADPGRSRRFEVVLPDELRFEQSANWIYDVTGRAASLPVETMDIHLQAHGQRRATVRLQAQTGMASVVVHP